MLFKRWVTKDILPSIRKTGRYSYDDMNHKFNDSLTFKIENEMDLHAKVISFLKKRFPNSLFTAMLGENQYTSTMRIDSYKKGYLRGSPDLIINNLHKNYTGLCIEFKNPNGKGVLSPDQSMMLRQYRNNGFKTLISNDYDHTIKQLIEYFRDVRILCSYCSRRFASSQSLKTILRVFIKWLKEMKRRRAMDKLPRHVKCAFYCDVCYRAYPIRYMDRHHRTRKHKHNLLILENIPQIHPSEVKDILKD